MEQFILVSLFVSYLNGQEVTKTTMSCETETPEPTMRTVDKLKDTWEEFVKVYCEATFTPSQLQRLEKCNAIAHGKAIASSRRVCFQTMALPAWKQEVTPQFLKQKWCDDMAYATRIEVCLKNKIKTLPSSLFTPLQYKPQGLVTTGWKAMDCRRKILEF